MIFVPTIKKGVVINVRKEEKEMRRKEERETEGAVEGTGEWELRKAGSGLQGRGDGPTASTS